jgi:hypothetical protein
MGIVVHPNGESNEAFRLDGVNAASVGVKAFQEQHPKNVQVVAVAISFLACPAAYKIALAVGEHDSNAENKNLPIHIQTEMRIGLLPRRTLLFCHWGDKRSEFHHLARFRRDAFGVAIPCVEAE